jgi:RNA polymerase sigma-70 factor (ECF subfamily)
MGDDVSKQLLDRWRARGDQQAAHELFHRYAERLIRLVRTRLSEKLARRIDAEDIVQSVFNSFFAGARDERYVLERSGDLWRLLVAIALHKLARQVEHHSAEKRAVDSEEILENVGGLHGLAAEVLADDPTPSQTVALAEEVEQLMRGMDELPRQIFELRLQGYTLNEIADLKHRSVRTVRRLLDGIKKKLEQRYREHALA